MNRPTSPSQPRANTPIAPANVIVKKYGGTSVGTLERIENVAARLSEEIKLGQKPIVVASAMSGETNRLIGLGDTIDPQYRGPAYDMLVASGEQVSIALLAIALYKKGIQAQPLLGYQLGIQTDSTSSKARIQ
ncbi:MAG: aspartate kinase, partial [Pseudobdellovibrionaceae bacterium]